MDKIEKDRIEKLVSPGWFEYYDRIGSTNDVALQWLKEGAPDLSLVAANEQTKGRGRHDRQWFTPPDSALAFSLVLTDSLSADNLPYYTGIGALAVCKVIESVSDGKVEIKWPNDVLVEGKKAAGILVEGSWAGDSLSGIIVGVGINVTEESVPPQEELLFPATCVQNVSSKPVDRFDLLAKIILQLKLIREKMTFTQLVKEWDMRLAFKGEKVYIHNSDGEQISGVLIGLSDRGELILEEEDGKRGYFSSNEIRLRPFSF